ncbi:hypothetical protein NUACC21_26630 [Scytonema sp. NUACC21]
MRRVTNTEVHLPQMDEQHDKKIREFVDSKGVEVYIILEGYEKILARLKEMNVPDDNLIKFDSLIKKKFKIIDIDEDIRQKAGKLERRFIRRYNSQKEDLESWLGLKWLEFLWLTLEIECAKRFEYHILTLDSLRSWNGIDDVCDCVKTPSSEERLLNEKGQFLCKRMEFESYYWKLELQEIKRRSWEIFYSESFNNESTFELESDNPTTKMGDELTPKSTPNPVYNNPLSPETTKILQYTTKKK